MARIQMRNLMAAGIMTAAVFLGCVTALGAPLQGVTLLETYQGEYDEETYESYGYGHIQTPGLQAEDAAAYPALSERLQVFAQERKEELTDQLASYIEDARQAREEDGFSYEAFLEAEIILRRADDQALSFWEYDSDYQGGAHGYYSYTGYSFDTASGQEIALTDVIARPEQLNEIIGEKLSEAYPDNSIGTLDGSLEDYGLEAEKRSYHWVLENQGITFVFNPYEIASYAEGALFARIGFAQYPELFTGRYAASDGGYAYQLLDWPEEMADLDGDGRAERISVSLSYDDYGARTGITVSVDGQSATADGLYFYGMRPLLMHTAEGKTFLYLDLFEDNDYHEIQIFDLSPVPVWVGGISAGTGMLWDDEKEGTLLQIPGNPARFLLDNRVDLLSTYTVQRAYEVSASGNARPLEDTYTAYPHQPLVTIKELPAQQLTQDTHLPTGQQISIPAGETLQIRRTDGIDTVDLEREDGFWIRIVLDNTDWPHRIAGEDETDFFEALYYAG